MFCLSLCAGVRGKDLAGIRCLQAKNLIAAIDDCIIREEAMDSLNENGAAFVSDSLSTFTV